MKQNGHKSIGIEKVETVNIDNSGNAKLGNSLISEILILLADEARPIDDVEVNLDDYDIPEKLDHNSLIKYRFLIEDDMSWYDVEEVFGKLDRAGQKRLKIMKEISLTYKEVLGDFRMKEKKSAKMTVVRENSDLIVDEVIDRLCELVYRSENREKLYTEEVRQGVKSIVAFGIVECKVLEKPPKGADNANS